MKKIVLLVMLALATAGCNENYKSEGPTMPFKIEVGSVRTTETKDYAATETCVSVMLNGTPVWKLESIKKKSNTIVKEEQE